MAEPFHRLTPAEAERLFLLAEEAGELVQAIGKILRHGYESRNPDGTGASNRAELAKEIGDIRVAVRLLIDAGDVPEDAIAYAVEGKIQKLPRYLHHQEQAHV